MNHMCKAATRIFAALALAAIAITQPACQPGDLFPAKRTPLMNELTTNMKTVCFGRYLVDVPQKAEFAMGFTKSDAVRIEPAQSPSSSDGAFQNRLVAREKELRALTHETEGTRFRAVSELPDGRGKLFQYRDDAEDDLMTVVEALVRHTPGEWLLKYKTSDENVPEIKRETEEVAAALDVRVMTDVPTTAGACIRDGVLKRVPRYVEEFAGGARIEDLSWSLSLRSETSKRSDYGKPLLKRADESIDMAGGFSSGIKVLRKHEITLDGRKGEEFVALYPGKGVASLSATLELYGDATYKVPTLKLIMEANRLSPPDPNDKRVFLSDDEALAVWDAVLKSIRPRPGAF
jgi:hypothetical protein